MEESELREQIRQKISEGTLPRDPSVFSTYPVDVAVKEARGEPCSVCGRPIDPPQPFNEFRSPRSIPIYVFSFIQPVNNYGVMKRADLGAHTMIHYHPNSHGPD